jgi:PAS domain S-box-containing protein
VNPSDVTRRLEALARTHNLDLERLLADFADYVEQTASLASAAPDDDTPLKIDFEGSPLSVNSLIEGCLLIDRSGRILEASQPVSALCGYTRAELMTMNLSGLIVTSELRSAAGGPSLIRLRHRGGYPVSALMQRIDLDADRAAVLLLDTAVFQQGERHLRHIESIYRGLLDSQIDLICRYTPDTVLTYVNEAYCTYFGKPREDLIGTSFLTLQQVLDPEMVYRRIQTVLRDPTPDVNIVAAYTIGGEPRWVQWVDYGIRDERGVVTEIQAIGRDVTPLFTLQRALAERENMLSAMFAKIPLMLVLNDPAAKYIYVNDYFTTVTGWTAEAMSAHPNIMAEFYPDEAEREQVVAFIRAATGEWRDFKTRVRTGKIVDTSWANVRLADGRTLGIGQVITERLELKNQRVIARQLELDLEKEREIRALRDRYIALVAHELRTPLTLALSSLEIVLNYASRLPPERIAEKLTLTRDQLVSMGRLIEDALRYTRDRALQTNPAPRALDLKAACGQVIDRLRQIDDGAHDFTLSGDDGLAWCDPALLESVLTNLLHNAIKYSLPGTAIAVEVRAEADRWSVSVSDQGIGIPEHETAKIFQPFFRGSNTVGIAGSGFGLSIVHEHVIKMGGTIAVSSVVGQGSTFTFTLPYPPADAQKP